MTTTATRSIEPAARLGLMYADLVLKDVTPEMFRHKPDGVDCSTPAFNFGHLTLYPDMVMDLLGRDDLAEPEELKRFEALFSREQVCHDDPDGTIYPPMDEIVVRFKRRYEAALGALADADASVLDEPNPRESNRKLFATKGDAITFYLTGHLMMHLGQVSTWRRCMGLGACM
jgi:hypothetical protein